MPISINTNFFPYRLNLQKREPVQLTVELINRSEETKKLTMQLSMTRELSLDKGGLNSGVEKRVDSLKPNERQKFVFDIYSRNVTRAGEHQLQVKVIDHFADYNYVKGTQTKNMELTVIE